MAIDPNQYMQQGRDYAAGMAASQDPFINLYRNRLGLMKSREALAQEISGMYQPAIEAARGIGTNVANVGQAGLSAMTGLASALPGAGVEGLAEAYRGAARAGGSAALLGTALETGARQGLAESIMQRQAELQQEQFGTQEKMAGAESEKARLGADWLGAAQGFQGMGQTAQEMQFAAEEQPLKLETMRAQIGQILADTSLTETQKAAAIQEMGFNAELQPGKVAQQTADIKATKAQTGQVKATTNQIVKETKSMPPAAKARYFASALAKGQITGQMLENAVLTSELRKAGYKVTTGKGGKVSVTGPDGNPVRVAVDV